MSGKTALYLTIARRCISRGETGRAIVTIVNALRNNPQFIDRDPEATAILASIIEPAFFEDVHRLASLYPSFADKLTAALDACGREDVARRLEQSFSAYCIDRMIDGRMFDEQNSAQESADLLMDSRLTASRLMASRFSSDGCEVIRVQESLADLSASGSVDISAAAADWNLAVHDDAVSESVQNIFGTVPDLQISRACFYAVPEDRPAAGKSGVRLRRIIASNDTPSAGTDESSYAWMAAAAHENFEPNHNEYRRSRIKAEIGTESVRTFSRINTAAERMRSASAEAVPYADSPADRRIIDFDNSVPLTPKDAMFASGQMKIRTYAEEVAEYASKDRITRTALGVQTLTPLEKLAQTTHELSETPSVEPYTVRHPLRFRVSAQVILTCVLACILGAVIFVTYQSVQPYFERKAFERVSFSYISAAESGDRSMADRLDELSERENVLVDREWLKSYKLFLNAWQHIYFAGDNGEAPLRVSLEEAEALGEYSAAHAAYIMQEIYAGNHGEAQKYYDSVPQSVWRDHSYFHVWTQAVLSESVRDFHSAIIKYDKLLRTPLAPFALVQLAQLSLEQTQTQAEAKSRFLSAYDKADHHPYLADCIASILRHGESATAQASHIRLNAPYAQYCAIGRIFSSIYAHHLPERSDIDILRTSAPLKRGEVHRIDGVIEADLLDQNVQDAAQFYQSLRLPDNHPLHLHIRNKVFMHAFYSGNWDALRAFLPNLPADMNYLTASRIIDMERTQKHAQAADIQRTESILTYGISAPQQTSDLVMDEAYSLALSGQFERALSLTHSLLETNPDRWEPLFLQAMILSRTGRTEDAASLIESRMARPETGAPLIVLSNLYRARAGMRLNTAAFALNLVQFDDPVLEGARCEIFQHTQNPRANACFAGIKARNGRISKAAWMMTAKAGKEHTAAKWAKAGADYLSTPGYFLAFARVLICESQLSAAANAYARAIVDDSASSSPDTVAELEQAYRSHKMRLEGARRMEKIIAQAETKLHDSSVIGTLHLAAARLYQPKTVHPMVRSHLTRAMNLLGETPEILQYFIDYYEAKDKPEHARKYRIRLYRLEHPTEAVPEL